MSSSANCRNKSCRAVAWRRWCGATVLLKTTSEVDLFCSSCPTVESFGAFKVCLIEILFYQLSDMNTNNVFFFERLKPSMISVIWNPNLPENFLRRAESLFHRQSRSVSNFRTRTWNDFRIPKSSLSSSSKWSSKSSSSSPPADENFRSMILVKIRKEQLEKTCKVDPAPFQ